MGRSDGNPAWDMGHYIRQNVHPVARAVDALHKPYICALNGTATGAGLDMALMADIRYAARSARFAETYIKVGLVPGDGGAFLLQRLVGWEVDPLIGQVNRLRGAVLARDASPMSSAQPDDDDPNASESARA